MSSGGRGGSSSRGSRGWRGFFGGIAAGLVALSSGSASAFVYASGDLVGWGLRRVVWWRGVSNGAGDRSSASNAEPRAVLIRLSRREPARPAGMVFIQVSIPPLYSDEAA